MTQISKPSRTRATRIRPAWDLPLRIVTGAVGGYVLTSLGTMLLARTLPGTPLDTAMAATLMSFAIYTAAIVWVFAARTGLRAASSTLGLTVLIGAAVWFLRHPGVTP